ncbi:hypothetical protein [Pelotomaculum propionicicum]|uniref:hypothetical protein n=1 Tax=Pelotomaculum propionicicum TaxID=258475 RepID=UPI001FAA8FA7|nr:hypothetical protein [Pelotomaculum propionicicum]
MTGRKEYSDECAGNRHYTRFNTLDGLRVYLENPVRPEFAFCVYPVSGKPETFNYNSLGQVVTRLADGSSFDSLEDFLCYVFQCDREGYPNTEYVDVVVE